MDVDGDANGTDAGEEQAKAGPGLARGSSGPWFLSHLPLLHPLAALFPVPAPFCLGSKTM